MIAERPRNVDRSLAAEVAFRAHLANLGAELLVPYNGSKFRHHCRCSAGHDCYPRPNSVQSMRSGICRVCARNDPAAAEAAFLERLTELGAIPLYGRWNGNGRPLRVRCPSGHDCYPRPNDVQQGDGVCRACAGRDPVLREAAFRERLAELGATPLYEKWLGAKIPHHVRCKAGHDAYPAPSDLQCGQGPCFACAHAGEWDAFYVVTSAGGVKFGITTGDPRRRLRAHARAGYTEVIRLVTDLAGTAAPDVERAIRQALAMAGEKPVKGREYFGIGCLALVLDIADSWLAAPQAPVARTWIQAELFAA